MTDTDPAALGRRQVQIFLALCVLLVGAAYIPILQTGRLGTWNGMAVMLVMWAPGVAGMLTQLITTHSLKGMGWRPRTWGLIGLALILPFFYAGPVYGLTWASGLAAFNPQGWQASAPGFSVGGALVLLLTAGMLQSLISGTGEEIGWRGLLVPALSKFNSFRRVALFSSLIWLLYHVPLILAADYHGEGTPRWFSLICFAAMVLAMGTLMAWLRVASGSLWPPAVLHGSHNLIVQAIFDGGTKPGPWSGYVTGEFGLGLVLTIGVVAWVMVSKRSAETLP
jgi:uncharacterized protein